MLFWLKGVVMVNVGCFLPTYSASGPIEPASVLDMARDVEELGLDHVWVGDHYLWNVGMLSPLPALAAVAAVTRRVRLGTGVYLLNLRHPALTAKDVATVDVLSGGRLVLGAGIGGDNPEEYRALGVDPGQRARRFEETAAAVRGLLAGSGQPYQGRLVDLPAFTMEPLPVQQPVPLWLGGRASAVVERAARGAEGWFPVWVSAGRFRAAADTVGTIRGDLSGFAFALNLFTTIADTREAARDAVSTHLATAYGLPFDSFERYSAYGTADDIREYLAPYVEAGMTDVVFNIAGPDPRGQLRRLAAEVVPALR
ncbi:TIGR03619 family F420-dependent LLM class oxidoreductase [Micromonospora chalcea]